MGKEEDPNPDPDPNRTSSNRQESPKGGAVRSRQSVGILFASLCFLTILGALGVLSPTVMTAAPPPPESERSLTQEDLFPQDIAAPKLQKVLEVLLEEGEAAVLKAVAPPSRLFARSLAQQEILPGAMAESYFSLKTEEGRVRVAIETVSEPSSVAVARAVSGLGGIVEIVEGGGVQAWVPLEQLRTISELEDVEFVRLPVKPRVTQGSITSEGLEVINSPEWNEAGLDGEGVKVALVDPGGFYGYERLLGRELPPEERVVTRSFRSDKEMYDPEASRGARVHGLATAEIVYDVAPGAALYLTMFSTDLQFRRAVNWLIEEDVDVINTSLGFPSGCFQEGGGIFADLFEEAKRSGITWATAAGNEGDVHWQGDWNDPDGDDLLNYTATDEGNTLDVVLVEYQYPSGKRVATSLISAIFSWDAPCRGAPQDYELIVMREEGGKLVPLPDWNGSVGQLTDWVWRPGVPIQFIFASEDFDVSRVGEVQRYHLAIRKKRAGAPDSRFDLTIGCPCRRIQFLEREGSVSITEPSISPDVITVGAIHHSSLRCSRLLCPDGRLLVYSSRGPTKDGRIKPDLAAPSHVSTSSYGRWTGDGRGRNPGFTGTSAASPHVAGAAALAIQALRQELGRDPTPDEVQQFLEERAEDAGDPGKDNDYGAGILFLAQPPGAPAGPLIAGIEPAEGLQGTTVEAVIQGENLEGATEVTFSGTGVTATIREGGTATELPIVIAIAPDAAPGPRTFTVITPAGTAESGEIVFTVLEAPRIAVEPPSLSFAAVLWQDPPAPQTLKITNAGGGTLQWEASANAPWLQLSATQGEAPSELSVSVLIEGLEPGDYEGTIAITAEGAVNSPLIVPVTLIVEVPPGELLAIRFVTIEFVVPEDWERTLRDSCVVYTNISDGPSVVRLTLDDGSVREFEIPAGNEVIVCGDVAHIDTRYHPPEG